MNIIKKIEIKFFRSFGEKTKLYDLNDLNIISGSNDSGKSNVLRAMNLFFNEKIDLYHNYNFENDFSRAQEWKLKGQQKAKSYIEIKILFSPEKIQYNSKILPEKFWIIKQFYKDNINVDIKNEDGKDIKYTNKRTGKEIKGRENVKRASTNFLKKINFQYIPAIRDTKFFDYLKSEYQNAIGKLETILDPNEVKTIKEWREKMTSLNITRMLDEKIKKESETLFETFSVKAPEIKNANFNIPYLKIDYSHSLDIETDEKIFLASRGDGIQAKFIPVILDEIAKRNKEKPIVIWAFEEPENSYEYKNSQKLADDLLNEYSQSKQIFVTTHSFNFLSLSAKNVSTYRVCKNDISIKGPKDTQEIYSVSRIYTIPDNDISQMKLFEKMEPSEREKLEEELGIYEMSKDLQKLYLEKKAILEKLNIERTQLSKQINSLRPLKILICEDGSDKVKKLWEKWLKYLGINNVFIMSSNGSTTSIVEETILVLMSMDNTYKPKIFREVDRDSFTDKQIKVIEDKIFKSYIIKFKKLYKYKYLPVNEIENFAVQNDGKTFSNNYWKNKSGIIIDKFMLTAESICKKAVKLFEKDTQEYLLFSTKDGGNAKITQLMRDSALTSWKKYFPGKDICSQTINYEPLSELNKIKPQKLPTDLKKYLNEIKIFFR